MVSELSSAKRPPIQALDEDVLALYRLRSIYSLPVVVFNAFHRHPVADFLDSRYSQPFTTTFRHGNDLRELWRLWVDNVIAGDKNVWFLDVLLQSFSQYGFLCE